MQTMSKPTKIKVAKKAAYPAILSYPQGLPLNSEDMQILTGMKGDGKTAKMIVLSEGGSKTVRYKGTNFGDSSLGKDCCKFAIGVRNKVTGALKIIKTDHIFPMKPCVDSENSKKVARQSSMSWQERRSGLTEEFGSKKKKRAFQAAKSNTISAENISGASAIESLLGNRSASGNNALLDAAERAVGGKFSRSKK
jgi:hypothetical protein